MTAAFNMIFTFITTMFTACNNLAQATENVTKVADEASANYLKQQQILASKRNLELEQELSELTESLSSTTTAI